MQAVRLQKYATEKLPSCLGRLRVMTLSFCISCSLEMFLLCLTKVSYRAYRCVAVERVLEFSLGMFCFSLGLLFGSRFFLCAMFRWSSPHTGKMEGSRGHLSPLELDERVVSCELPCNSL